MFAPLVNSERFQNEYQGWRKQAALIEDENARKEVDTLLNQLHASVMAIDDYHNEILVSRNVTTSIENLRSRVQSLRQEIDTKLNGNR